MPMIAYNPTLCLVESHVASYKIYILKNPITNEIFYVGQTVNDLSERLAGHIAETGANRDKIHYIKNIIDQGGRPIIQEIETIHTTCYIDKASVNEREMYWIRYYRGIGCTLLNIANPRNYEYQTYLSSLKKGETKWHYYYCGKTYGGHEVYDERKLKADGFKFPESTTREVADPSYSGYNPWQNERFIKKNGYRISYDDPFSYVPCYNDTNPDFYDDDY